MSKKLVFILSSLFILWPVYLHANGFKDAESYSSIKVFYSPLSIMSEPPLDTGSISYLSEHAILIVNEEKIKTALRILFKSIKEKLPSKGIVPFKFGVILLYEFVKSDGSGVETIIIDRDRNFDFSGVGGPISGKLSKENFSEFITFSESVKGIIDLGIQRRLMLE